MPWRRPRRTWRYVEGVDRVHRRRRRRSRRLRACSRCGGETCGLDIGRIHLQDQKGSTPDQREVVHLSAGGEDINQALQGPLQAGVIEPHVRTIVYSEREFYCPSRRHARSNGSEGKNIAGRFNPRRGNSRIALLDPPRQAGKTTLLQRLFGNFHRFVSLGLPDIRAAAITYPRGFLAAHPRLDLHKAREQNHVESRHGARNVTTAERRGPGRPATQPPRPDQDSEPVPMMRYPPERLSFSRRNRPSFWPSCSSSLKLR